MPTTIPILSAPDLEAAARYYAGFGFAETGRWPDYLILVHPLGIELHVGLDADHDDSDPASAGHHHGGACYIRIETEEEARALHADWARASDQGSISQPRETHYGLLEFGVDDPFGNTISVGGALDRKDR